MAEDVATKTKRRVSRKAKRGANSDGQTGACGNYIAAWRRFRGISSQGQLAKLSGVTRATINRLESGKLPYRQWLLDKLAPALRCQPHDLIGVDPYGVPDIVLLYLDVKPEQRPKTRAGDLIKR